MTEPLDSFLHKGESESNNIDHCIVQDSALARLDLQLTESERRLIDEFYEGMEGIREENKQEYKKSLYDSSINYTESALKRIECITDEYLKKGIRLNSRDDDRDETVTNLIFKEIVGVLDSVIYINSSTVALERSNSSNNESQEYDDTDEISSNSLDIVKNIASNLLLKGGKVRHDLFYHGRIGYATTAFMDNNNSLQFNEYIVAQCKEIKDKLENLAYESTANKSKQAKNVLRVDRDNEYFYIEYSQDSIVEVVKILNNEKAKDLNLRAGILKIGESTVRVESKGEKRNYTDLTDNSDIALTFHTSEGELEVRLYPDMRNKDLIRVEVNNQDLLKRLKGCKEEIGKNCLLGGLSVNKAIEQRFFDRSGKLRQPSETMSSSVNSSQQSHGYELKAAQPTKQQLLQDLCNVESNVTKKEKDFDTKTHLIDIFKILHKLPRDKENVSKIDLANVAEKESKRLGLEGRYNWNGLFGLEKAVSQNIEQEGSSLPLSSDLYRQDKLASSVSNKVEKCTTKGDGNCFFHAVFGDSSSGIYKTDRAKEMRQEWNKFLSQFESLDDPKMPKALRERLSLVFRNVFPMQELDFCTSNLYKEYLSKVNEQSYFIYVEEVPILASLASIEVEIYYTQKLPDKIKPNPGMINANYKTNQELWGSKVQEAIYLEGNHYSRAEVTAQPQKDFPPYSEPPRCGIIEPMVESYQQGYSRFKSVCCNP